MNKTLLALTISALVAMVGCSDKETSASQAKTSAPEQTVAPQVQSAEQEYLALVDRYFNDMLKLEPMYATFVEIGRAHV